jgi:hypothetical protein
MCKPLQLVCRSKILNWFVVNPLALVNQNIVMLKLGYLVLCEPCPSPIYTHGRVNNSVSRLQDVSKEWHSEDPLLANPNSRRRKGCSSRRGRSSS